MEIALLSLRIQVIKQQFIEPSRKKDWIALQTSYDMPTGLKEASWEAIGTRGAFCIHLEDRAFYLVLIWHSS